MAPRVLRIVVCPMGFSMAPSRKTSAELTVPLPRSPSSPRICRSVAGNACRMSNCTVIESTEMSMVAPAPSSTASMSFTTRCRSERFRISTESQVCWMTNSPRVPTIELADRGLVVDQVADHDPVTRVDGVADVEQAGEAAADPVEGPDEDVARPGDDHAGLVDDQHRVRFAQQEDRRLPVEPLPAVAGARLPLVA